MTTVDNIIKLLGYEYSSNLHYFHVCDNVLNHKFSWRKILAMLNPVAYYCVDDKPFIFFFACQGSNIPAKLKMKIWNAQIPLAIFVLENRIEIFNGCSLDKEKDLVLLEIIDECDQVNETSPFSYWNISDASFWERYSTKLSEPKLDTFMLENIQDVTNKLRQSSCAPFAIPLVLRLIFIRYLIDRGTDLDYVGLNGNIEKSQTKLLDYMQTKDELYHLFAHLKTKFNGNLFENYQVNSITEKDLIDESSLKILQDLMSGTLVLSSGQMSFFPLYDFNIIPVELISNIYERFLGEERQKNDKAFYTPTYLVDYLLKDTVDPFLASHEYCKILDPACGSGIFLVEASRRLIEKNKQKYKADFDDEKLISCITKNIWGIDKNPEAIDVAIFSIYLTILDYKDSKTLKNFKLPLLKEKNIFAKDFFSKDIDIDLAGKDFDFIIGNPPWGSVDGLHIEYCNERQVPKQNNEISRSFVLRTKDFSTEKTCCCLIVSSKLFYNTKSPAKKFRLWMLKKTKIHKYIELAAVREFIFSKVRGPAGIVIYSFNTEQQENEKNEISHLTIKPNIFFKLFNIIVIEKNDYKFIPQSAFEQNDWLWKTVVFGYSRDYILVKNLLQKHASINSLIKERKLCSGTGIKTSDGKQDATHLRGKSLLSAQRGLSPFHVDTAFMTEFNKTSIDRTRQNNEGIFQPPYALIKKGFDMNTFKFRAAYSDEAFLYTDAITGISGAEKEALLSFVGLFNSSFYAYLNLMMGSSTGIEREQGFPTEIFRYPAIIDEEIACLVEQIQNALTIEKTRFSNVCESEKLIAQLDKIILEKFGLTEDVFVDYALNVQIPLIAHNKMLWDKVSSTQLITYATVFMDYFNKIFAKNEKYVLVKIHKSIMGHYSAVELVFQDVKPQARIIEAEEGRNVYLSLISKLAINQVNDMIYQMRDIISYEENTIYILKTDENRNWHPAMAKLDLENVLNSIFTKDKATSL